MELKNSELLGIPLRKDHLDKAWDKHDFSYSNLNIKKVEKTDGVFKVNLSGLSV